MRGRRSSSIQPTRRTIVAAALTLPFARPGRAASPKKPVVATFGAMDLAYLPNIIAVEQGIAAANGLDLKLRITEGGPQSRTMVAAGEAQFQHGDTTLPLQLSAKGIATKILLSTEDIAPYANLVVRQDLYAGGIDSIEKLADWKRPDGSRPIVAVSTIGAGTWIWGTFLFEKIGKGDAINFVAGGASFTLLAGLASKRFDAMMTAPDGVEEAQKNKWGHVVFDVTDTARWNSLIGGPVPASSIYTLQSTIDSDPDMVKSYVRAMLQSLAWLKSASDDDVVKLVRTKYMPNLAAESIKYGIDFHRKTMNFSGRIDPEQFARASAVWFRKSTGLKPTTYADAVDSRFLQAASTK
ncbi:MAG TPA: ABC transporter substrate-binding protein [Bradyrhizobium sp.]|nr:ABC transporter substrate-binding protein [Bradyrhizobium sp.]